MTVLARPVGVRRTYRRVAVALVALVVTGAVLGGCAGGSGSGKGSGGSRRTGSATLNDIKGRSPVDVRSALGAPTLTRREPPAEVWQYSGQSCVLDVVFYPPKGQTSGELKADWVGSRSLDGSASDPASCLKQIGQ